MSNILKFLVTLGFVVCMLSCNIDTSNEIIILLPGEVNGQPIILAETSANKIFICSGNEILVPSLILKVWWNENLIITENCPMELRNLYKGDLFEIPDRLKTCWYVIHPESDAIVKVSTMEELNGTLLSFGISPKSVSLHPLDKAQILREKQLGFRFTIPAIYSYLESQRKDH